MKEKYPDTYTVFAGGDDLFLLGAWDEILKLAREIEKEFKEFVKSDDLSISFGIALAKPSTPISYLANHTEELLEEAKDIDENKDAISLFGETVKWSSYKKTFEVLQKLFENFDDPNTATLYRLLDFCKMSKEMDVDIKNSMWKSKLNYHFKRNVDKKYHHILGDLSQCIEKNPKETKMFLSEFIYKRRKQ
jgi:CRISPR-associated protein Csm1